MIKYNIHKAILKYGEDKFQIALIESHKDKKYAFCVLEPKYILEYNTKFGGYNMTFGGNGGGSETEEQKECRIGKSVASRRANGGWIPSEETKEKIRNTLAARWKIEFPDGSIHVVTSLNKFCIDNNLNRRNLYNTMTGYNRINKSNGYTLLEKLG